MPFYNVTNEESNTIRDFTQRRVTRRTMTFVGGQQGPVQTTDEKSEKNEESATPYLDCVTGVVESVLRRYALTCLAVLEKSTSSRAAKHADGKENPLPSSTATITTDASHSTGERDYPFPSLFLHTPKQLVDMQDELVGSHRRPLHDDSHGTLLSNTHCASAMPPAELLYTHARTGATAATDDGKDCNVVKEDRVMVPVPLPCETSIQFPSELHQSTAAVLPSVSLSTARRMLNVSLMPPYNGVDGGASVQQLVQVVLQAEAGLVVACPSPLHSNGAAAGVKDAKFCATRTVDDDAVCVAPFLLSPDATSCVLVACRVTLHPSLFAAVAAAQQGTSSMTSLSVLQERYPTDYEKRLCFLRTCVGTATASMAHLDRAAGTSSVLEEMVWSSAIPAFAHAVHRHYEQLYAAVDATPAAALQFLEETLRAALPRCEASLPLLHVDWYVVGGIRMKKSAAPVLEAVFRAFFPPSSSSSARLSDPHTSTVLLREEVEVLSLTVRVAHRLREDGQCFWSFNTTFQPWCVDPNARQRYAFPMAWGLLLSVSTGQCWPATVQPGTRLIPLAEVRHIVTEVGYRWITPLASDRNHCQPRTARRHVDKHKREGEGRTEEEAEEEGDDTGATGAGLIVACNTVPSDTVVQRMHKLACVVPPEQRLWSEFHACASPTTTTTPAVKEEGGSSSAVPSTMSLTLARYVRTMMSRQEAWWAARRLSRAAATSEAATTSASSPQPQLPLLRVFPVLLRRYFTKCERGQQKDEVVDWARLPWELVKDALTQPKTHLLRTSTTPHCEPPDFCDLIRNQLLWRASVSPNEVFVANTDGLYIE
jgi:hypothetical protein